MKWLLPVVGLLLIIMAVRSVALKVAGKGAYAMVTEVKQVVDSQSSQMDHNYSIGYQFQVNGKSYSGSLRRNKVYNVTTLPSVGDSVSVRYIPSMPQINGNSKENPLMAVVLGGLGMILLVAGFKPGKKRDNIAEVSS